MNGFSGLLRNGPQVFHGNSCNIFSSGSFPILNFDELASLECTKIITKPKQMSVTLFLFFCNTSTV